MRKAIVVAAPVPPFVGTRISIRLDDPASLTWGMQNIQLASGHEKSVIEWGDGSRDEVTLNGARTHAYARAGKYEVRISNDTGITELHFAGESEAKIRTQSGFNTGFGAVNATVSFDL